MDKLCAYCGASEACTTDHVIPKALYPPSKARSSARRITVKSCQRCNNQFSEDEAHFRNVMLVSGPANNAVHEIWEGKFKRSMKQPDGPKRLRDIAKQMFPVEVEGKDRHMIYPGRDERVLRIIRKILRGLCHYHGLLTAVTDQQVWATIQIYQVPPAFLEEMVEECAEGDIVQYRYGVVEEPEIHSCWTMKFFERTSFFGIVFHSVDARLRLEARAANGGT